MSQEDMEVARKVLAAVERRDLEGLVSLTDPEIEWQSFFAVLSEGGYYHGHSGLNRYFRDLGDSLEHLRPTVDDLLAAGDVVIAIGRLRYRGRGSGFETEVPAGWMFKFRNGKLLRFRAFREPERALEATGLSQ